MWNNEFRQPSTGSFPLTVYDSMFEIVAAKSSAAWKQVRSITMANDASKNPNGKPAEKNRVSDDKASKEYLKDYLKKVYGVKMSGAHNAIQVDLAQSGQHRAVEIVAEEFVFRLLARFNDLDVAPCDGFVSMAELEYAINNPRLHFDEQDNIMFRIVKRYYLAIKEVAAQNDPDSSPHHGITRQDLEIIAESTSKNCVNLRKKLQDEFTAAESAK